MRHVQGAGYASAVPSGKRHEGAGADYYTADCETAVSALDAAINANALTAEETGWAKLLRYYLVNPNSGYSADYPKTPAELEN